MILKEITVRSWRSILGEIRLDGFSDRLNVIHAPNGTGKTSIFEALRRVLFDQHTLSGEQITAVRPWGRDLNPTVQVVFAVGNTTYRASKTFIDATCAVLERLEDGVFRPLAEGRNADQKLREILLAEAPGRGASKPEHWGLAQALWVPQGQLPVTELSGSLVARIRGALGATAEGLESGKLDDLIAERWNVHFTPKGQLKRGSGGSPLAALEDTVANLEVRKTELRNRLQSFEDRSREVQDAEAAQTQAGREIDALQADIDGLRKKASHQQNLRIQLAQASLDELKARADAERLAKLIEDIKDHQNQIKAKSGERADLVAQLEALGADLRTAEANAAAAKAELVKHKNERQALAPQRLEVAAARTFLTARGRLQELSSLLSEIDKAESEARELQKTRSALIVPSSAELKNAADLGRERVEIMATLRSGAVTLLVEPEVDLEVKGEAGTEGPTGHHAAGSTAAFSGNPTVGVRIVGVGRIAASVASTEAEQLHQRLAEIDGELGAIRTRFGTADPMELQESLAQARSLDKEIKQAESKLKKLLGSNERKAIEEDQSGERAKVTNLLKDHPEWDNAPPDPDAMEAALGLKANAVEEAVGSSEELLGLREAEVTASKLQIGKREATLAALDTDIKGVRRNLDAWLADGLDDEQRQANSDSAKAAHDKAMDELARLNQQFNSIDGDPAAELKTQEGVIGGLREVVADCRDRVVRAQADLANIAREAPYSELADCEESLEEKTRQRDALSSESQAIKLLRETVEACRREAIEAVTGPVEHSASRMLERIAGPRLGRIRVTIGFEPQALTPPAIGVKEGGNQVAVENLSGGETEQLFLVTRLALGEILAQEERQLVVLDDVLNATDTGRLARVLNVLEEAANRLQIVILTCHPERYRGLPDARFFDLQQLA